MNSKPSLSEPPPKNYNCYVDVQCIYADINVPSDACLNDWVTQTIEYLLSNNKLGKSKKLTNYELTIRIVDETESQSLNNDYRDKNKPTNVLSFPFDLPDVFKSQDKILGDIIICAPVVEAEAMQQHKAVDEHWAHMVVHGVLHLLGYDHMNNSEAEAMETLEIKILSQLGYKNPYMELMHE